MTIKEALLRAGAVENGTALVPRLTHILTALNSNAKLNDDARSDLISIIDDGLELAAAMLNESYPAELILKRTTNILATSQRILMHTETARPGKRGFGAISAEGQILPIMANTQEEAQSQLDTLISMGLSHESNVIPIRISSQFVLQPRAQPPGQPEIAEPQYPATNEFAEALDRAERRVDMPTFGERTRDEKEA